MAIVIKPITVEVSKPNVFQAIAAKQNDSNSRFLKVTFANEGEKINVISSAKVTINAERNDGQSNSFFGEVNDDGTVTVPVHSWILALPGYVNCDVSIIEEDSKLTSTTFTLLVEEASHGSDDISTDEQYDVLGELINEVNNMQPSAIYGSSIPNTKSGTAVAITDISPIEHTLKIKATSDTADVSTAKVQRYGGNILNQDHPNIATIINENGWKQENNTWVGLNAYYRWLIFGAYHLSKGQTITLSFDCEIESTNGRYCLGTSTDAPYNISSQIATNGKNTVSYTATENIDLYVGFTDYLKSAGNYKIRNIMLCYGTNTEFEPYTEPTTYDISTDGTVEGVKSLYPTTTLIPNTEGIVLDATYNVDTKKYIDNKFAELAALIVNS